MADEPEQVTLADPPLTREARHWGSASYGNYTE
jgi:hypothetical protein